MPVLNFKPQFVWPILEGRKHHTIRAKRKIPIKPGQDLHLFTGLRQPGAIRILPKPVKCTRVQEIVIQNCPRCDGTGEVCYSSTNYGPCPVWEIKVDGQYLSRDECERLAVADGFKNFTEMMAFWDGRLPFLGDIIHWK